MAIELAFEEGGAGALIIASGECSTDDIYRVNRCLYDPDVVANLKYQLADFTNVERLSISLDVIRDLAEQDRALATQVPGMKVAIVAGDKFIEGLGNLYKSFLAGSDVDARIFKSMGEARRWLRQSVALSPAQAGA